MAADPKDVIEELFRRGSAGDESVIDELIAQDMRNHAASLLVKVEMVGSKSLRRSGPTLVATSPLSIIT